MNINLSYLNNNFEVVSYLNSNDDTQASYIAIGANRFVPFDGNSDLELLQHFIDENKTWLFGHLSYDLKNQIEKNLTSNHIDEVNFELIQFFEPQVLLRLKNNQYEIVLNHLNDTKTKVLLENLFLDEEISHKSNSIELLPRVSRDEYLKSIKEIKKEIQYGNIYEMNYCHEYYSEGKSIDVVDAYRRLNNLSKAPFSSFYKVNDCYCLSGSPERYIQKKGNKVISQPIKGTIKRGKDKVEDDLLMNKLYHDKKERSENVMIVDLVRNDLSRFAMKNTVNVDELFGIYSFNTVHQMISTISCNVEDNLPITDIIKFSFPMGSMTGAPKISAMNIIEDFEVTKRGLYSGSVGFITPNGDFDFNVVIRSILYNQRNLYTSVMVGGAITINSIPEMEYDETILKLDSMKRALNSLSNH